MMVNVGGEPSGRVRETITKDIREAEISGPGSKCEFQLKIPGKIELCKIIIQMMENVKNAIVVLP